MIGGVIGDVFVSELCLVEEVVPVGNQRKLCKHCELQTTAVFLHVVKS